MCTGFVSNKKVGKMSTILAHIKIKKGMEARFEEVEAELWNLTHTKEENVRRYEFFRGAEEGQYYGLLSFDDFNGFVKHQASPHHEEASGLGEVIESINLEWVDAVSNCSDLAPTDYQPIFDGANEVQQKYHTNFAPDVQDWWRAVRGS